MKGSLGKIYQNKLHARKRKRAAFVGVYSILAFGLAFSGLSFLSQMESISINEIAVSGTGERRAAAVEAAVWESISGNFISFFNKGNVLIFPAGEIRRKVVSMPFVQSAEIERDGARRLNIRLEERKESARWCKGEKGDTTACFSMDENGYVFDDLAVSSAFVYRGILSERIIGEQFLTSEEFKEIQFFVRELGRMGLSPMEASLNKTNYMTVHLLTGGSLIVRKDEDLSLVLSNLSSVLADSAVVPSLSEFLNRLDYMKLDSDSKVVYKLKNL